MTETILDTMKLRDNEKIVNCCIIMESWKIPIWMNEWIDGWIDVALVIFGDTFDGFLSV